MEVWKDIPGYEGLYQVSNLGGVKSIKRPDAAGSRLLREKILKPTIGTRGYLNVGLRKDNMQKKIEVHRLVAMAFIPNPQNLPQVNHKDEDKVNNCVDNLEWCSRSYNVNYGTRNGRMTKTKMFKLLLLIPTECLVEELERRCRK